MQSFNGDQQKAYEAFVALENRRDQEGTSHEVVLLEATNEQQLRATHGRYFGSDQVLAAPLPAKPAAT